MESSRGRCAAADVTAAEEAIGVPLPTDLTTWWMACGGLADVDYAPVVPEFYSPFSVGRSLEIRETMMRIRREAAGSLIGDLWLPLFVPIAVSASGSYLFVDLREGRCTGV